MHEDELTRLLRESAPDARPSDEHRRLLRMQLDHNFRRHRRRGLRLPSALAAAVIAALALVAGWSVPIGSDVTELLDAGRLGEGVEGFGDRRMLVRPFTGAAINTRDASEAARREAEQLADDKAAGAYAVVGIEGFTVDGRTFYEYLTESTGLQAGKQAPNVPVPGFETAGDEVKRVLMTRGRDELFRRLAADEWDAVSEHELAVGGMVFLVTTRTAAFAGLGQVQKHEGRRLR